jgi:hypothetical protein
MFAKLLNPIVNARCNQAMNYNQVPTHNKTLICNKIFKLELVQATTKIHVTSKWQATNYKLQAINKLQVATKLL